MKNYKIYFRLRGSNNYEIMKFTTRGLNCDDARRVARDMLGYDFYVLKAKLVR